MQASQTDPRVIIETGIRLWYLFCTLVGGFLMGRYGPLSSFKLMRAEEKDWVAAFASKQARAGPKLAQVAATSTEISTALPA